MTAEVNFLVPNSYRCKRKLPMRREILDMQNWVNLPAQRGRKNWTVKQDSSEPQVKEDSTKDRTTNRLIDYSTTIPFDLISRL